MDVVCYLQTVPPQWEGGRLFEPSPDFFMETAVTPERKVEKLLNGKSRNCSQGGILTVMPRAKNGSLTKIGVWQKSDFWTKNGNFGPKKK